MTNETQPLVDLFDADPNSDGIPVLTVHGLDLPRPSIEDDTRGVPTYKRVVHGDGTETVAYVYETWNKTDDGSLAIEMKNAEERELLCIDVTKLTRVRPIGYVEPTHW